MPDARMMPPDLHGQTCIVVTHDGRRCEAYARRDGPHGWLCPYHDGVARRRAQVAQLAADAPGLADDDDDDAIVIP